MNLPKPAALWIIRLLDAQDVKLPSETAAWWGWHLDGFLNYCRAHTIEREDVRVAARAYFDAVRRAEPPPAPIRLDQLSQTLTVFVRGIENWHWETDQTGAVTPRFRVKARTETSETHPLDSGKTRPPDQDDTHEAGNASALQAAARPQPDAPLDAGALALISRAVTALRARHYAYPLGPGTAGAHKC